ncbi:peptidoglycan DD-metalloendopeptidase family protein [Pseudoalteromonas denitrificans]|uniref:Murein DD-endopeptidase MepM and murein hydrolase activator NlpD, contain LysM domain n=1 Tax=Pseudoalteromonas denitrificans DSM 6059 TaxID=1123010 RepID=A0A1I1IIS5_9GAMM|nr:peptidoglycan DD-metalloendopeptidase family protein [Pseudoalteromonas denitrificans]SFC36184.1 Murein DD-endopeptidase MepM and murein hydrolase activator NlpD, contain LysM domain [Pseudoalteromonas denitrificans DSM 6059]
MKINDTVKRARLATEKRIRETKEATDRARKITPIHWQTAKVGNGDSLARIFIRLGFSAQTTYAVITTKGDESKLLKKLRIGASLKVGSNNTGQLARLEYQLSTTETLYINLVGDSYQSSKETKEVEIRESLSNGVISSNFWNAGVKAGLSDAQVINLANVFSWDIDFSQDIRKGDSFNVIYEKKYIDGEYIGTGNILAAEVVNKGDTVQAIRFTDNEYYTPDGNSMRKAFLRAPVNFKYISSSFKPKRFHPVQKRWKAHRGIDYAAKKGAPVVAVSKGKVTHSTFSKFNGNYVFIQHGNGIVTKYLHFSKREVKKGQRVKQGQVIGYVGDTGLAAGPHLHYKFLLNGVPSNPRTVKLPDAQLIANKYKAQFFTLANKRVDALNRARRELISSQDASWAPTSD